MSDCKKRFKGVENFLRRIAFNLGNTPSQTEVKIISCIPIDVTDLQQKIAELEKKLEEQKSRGETRPTTSPPEVVSTALAPEPSSKSDSKRTSVVNSAAVSTPMSHKRAEYLDSSVSTSASHPRKSTQLVSDSKYLQNENCKPQSYNYSQYQHLLQQPLKKGLFSKNKSRSKKKTEFVYYAKTDESTPFNKYGFKNNSPSKKVERHNEAELDETRYLSKVLWKQYIPRPALNNLSNHSEFSSPICRDDPPMTTLYESDVCSCFHGPFQNLDEHMKPFNTLHTFSNAEKEDDNKYSYYDSNAYDIVPVKENNTKKHNSPKPKKKHAKKHDRNIKCWSEKVTRPKKLQPIVVNYHTIAPLRNNSYKRYHKRDVVLRSMSSKGYRFRGSDQNSDDNRICYVDYSDVYARRKQPRKHRFNAIPQLNDASCLATIINNVDCQTTTETIESPAEDRTAKTLNQIKSILQSVLTEVKTNSKLRKSQEPKKDATVQNISQSNICGAEQLLQSCTYSPYNMNPYIASCSRQMTSNSYCLSSAPYGQTKCMHYPLFVQANRRMYSSSYNNGNGKPAGLLNTSAATAATNTEDFTTQRHSKETQKLIKDIYDSIALNIELPTKDTTGNKGDQKTNITLAHDLKTTPSKEAKDLISEIYKNLNPANTSVTEKTDSKVTFNTNSVRSEFNNNITVSKVITETSEGDTITSEQVNRKVKQVYEEESDEIEENESSDIIEGDDVIESSRTEDEPEQVDILESESYESDKVQKQNNKKGLFNKMMKIFQPRNRRKTKQTLKPAVEMAETTSDSDDYQTVYSHKITRKAQPTKHKRHNKAQPSRGRNTFSPERSFRTRNRLSPERVPRRQPYLEQEYRKYWDENIMFRNRHEKRSTEESGAAPQMETPYSRYYQTRVALPDPKAQMGPLKSTTYPVKRASFSSNKTSGNRLKKSNPKVGGLAWLKKHQLKVRCGEEWKKLILEG